MYIVLLLTSYKDWRKKVGADTIFETFPNNKYFKALMVNLRLPYDQLT
jgi:hypothetical protein